MLLHHLNSMFLPCVKGAMHHRAEVHEALQAQDRLKARGIDLIAVVTMDTPFAMQAWADQLGVGKDFLFLSDIQGQLAKSLGGTFQAGPFGLRPTRYLHRNTLASHLSEHCDTWSSGRMVACSMQAVQISCNMIHVTLL